MAKLLTVARQLASLTPSEQALAISFAKDLSGTRSKPGPKPRQKRKAKAAPAPTPVKRVPRKVTPLPDDDDDE